MSDPFPAQQPAFLAEWTFNNATVAPPANAQLRLNNGGQNNATLIWVSNITFNGINASAWLMEMITGCTIKVEAKTDPLKWQSYTITGEPAANSGYVELKVAWLAGGQNLASGANITLSFIKVVARVSGTAMALSGGNAIASCPVRVPVNALPALEIRISTVTATGQTRLHCMAFPSDTPAGFTPGMTIRQFYAAHALTGFIAKGIAHNLVGTVSDYAFKVADSMMEYEARERGGINTLQEAEEKNPTTPLTPP